MKKYFLTLLFVFIICFYSVYKLSDKNKKIIKQQVEIHYLDSLLKDRTELLNEVVEWRFLPDSERYDHIQKMKAYRVKRNIGQNP